MSFQHQVTAGSGGGGDGDSSHLRIASCRPGGLAGEDDEAGSLLPQHVRVPEDLLGRRRGVGPVLPRDVEEVAAAWLVWQQVLVRGVPVGQHVLQEERSGCRTWCGALEEGVGERPEGGGGLARAPSAADHYDGFVLAQQLQDPGCRGELVSPLVDFDPGPAHGADFGFRDRQRRQRRTLVQVDIARRLVDGGVLVVAGTELRPGRQEAVDLCGGMRHGPVRPPAGAAGHRS